MAGPKQDRLLLTRACKANLSQIFGLYPDPDGEVQRLLETSRSPAWPRSRRPTTWASFTACGRSPICRRSPAVAELMGPKPMFIADGHHRYETACNYRDELIADKGPLPPEHPANFVLMMCIGMSDPGLLVLPTHRLFRGARTLTFEQLADKLGGAFDAAAGWARGPPRPTTSGKKSKRPATRSRSACTPKRQPLDAGHADGPRRRARWPRSPPNTAATGRAWA